MAHTSLIPGFGFVVVDSTETALLPGLGFVNLDGGTVAVPATVNFSTGLPVMTSGIGAIASVTGAASLSGFGPLPAMTSGIGSLTVTTSGTQIVARSAFLRVGVKMTPTFTSIRKTKGGVSTEPSMYAQGGLPTTKVVNGQVRFRVGAKMTAVGEHRQMTGSAKLSLGVQMRLTYSAIQSGGQQTISRGAQWVSGVRMQANGVAIKNGAASFNLGVQMTALGVATQAGGGTGGTSGELSQTSITNVVNATLFALGVTPPAGLVEAIAASTLAKYENGLVDDGLTRLHHERLTSSVLLGNTFGLLTPPGAYVPPVGTLSGFFSYSGHKQRVTARCDGTRNRITLVYDPD